MGYQSIIIIVTPADQVGKYLHRSSGTDNSHTSLSSFIGNAPEIIKIDMINYIMDMINNLNHYVN